LLLNLGPTRNSEEPSVFTAGVGFDGSSIRGFQEIHESDMLLISPGYLDKENR
jgi:glutamine synthetase